MKVGHFMRQAQNNVLKHLQVLNISSGELLLNSTETELNALELLVAVATLILVKTMGMVVRYLRVIQILSTCRIH